MKEPRDDAVEQLRQIITRPEQERIDIIESRLDDPQKRSGELAALLPETLSKSYREDPRLGAALSQPVQDSLKQSIRQDPQFFGNLLYPVMGPAIRRAIAESLKAFVQSINQTLEHSFSLKSLSWRWQSIRTGVPFAEIVLRETLQYRVEEVFLIHSHTGLLLAHLNRPDVAARDSDAVSGMLTAIQDFVNDSFSRGSEGELDTIEVGQQTVWVIHGSQAYLAGVIRGMAPEQLRLLFNEKLEEVHRFFGHIFDDFKGNADQLVGLDHLLEPCLALEQKSAQSDKPKTIRAVILSLVLLLVLAWFGLPRVHERRKMKRLAHDIDQMQGVMVTHFKSIDGRWTIFGFRDPLSDSPEQLLARHHMEPGQLSFVWEPFQSLDSDIAQRRLISAIDPPDSIVVEIDSGEIRMSGTADPDWVQNAQIVARTLGIETIQWQIEEPGHHLAAFIDAPSDVKWSKLGTTLILRGTATWHWIKGFTEKKGQFEEQGIEKVNTENLDCKEWKQIEGNDISDQSVFFLVDLEIDQERSQNLETIAKKIKDLGRNAELLTIDHHIELKGYADAIGNDAENKRLAAARATFIRDQLIGFGIEPSYLRITEGGVIGQPGERDYNSRRVEIRAIIDPPQWRGDL